MSGVQWTGLVIFTVSASASLVYVLVAWGTREERRAQRHGLSRRDWLYSSAHCDEVIR